jgi:phosphoribosylaminoimidazole (AIR) synthetase
MVRTFNLGIGLTCVVHAEDEQVAAHALPEARRVGTVVRTAPGAARVTFA